MFLIKNGRAWAQLAARGPKTEAEKSPRYDGRLELLTIQLAVWEKQILEIVKSRLVQTLL